ncbi:MmgE/PrpD family protein [Mycolicibacterium senegalense]|uniref:MmgE/PrpD family protein n=3 Tax=Mycolicibacterium TaxID=1866885 RepID=A0ABX3VEG9_9MYCO|nr:MULTISPECIES: MmgE/PrpD family protein [Mycolicibacterium]OMB88442.1 MmgE/PrpD family protein [Mycolicibacterium conceptionense]ORV31608.1 MmgE/PrpD family protein [Mycolicibacterium conceptionense]QZH65996.1 MmgE/PrpD family protein [Mycolicibacterium farcinogenes]
MNASSTQSRVAPPSAPEGPTGRLVEWVHMLGWSQIPDRVRKRAAHLVLDGIGCGLIGAQLPWSRAATEAVLGIEGPGIVPVIGTGRTTTPVGATLLNSTFIQGFELDDFHPLAPLHSASVLVPSLLATAAHLDRPVSGRELLISAIAGFETGPRIGYALGGTEMLSRGWHSGPIFGGIASALACGRLRGLDGAQLEDAVGFAATQSAGLMSAQYEAMGKRMQHGFAARNGFYSAALAEAGYTGIDQVLERPYGGFLAVYGEGHDPDAAAVTRGLGENWETTVIMVKSWAVMGGLHGVVEAARTLRKRLAGRTIARIDIRVGEVIFHHGWWTPQRPLTAIGGQMNIGYAAAVSLLDDAALPQQFTAERLDADDVWQLLDRTHVELDRSIDELPLAERFQTHLTVTFSDGRAETATVIAPHGYPGDPVTDDELVAKFHRLVDPVMPADRATAIEQAVLGLPDADDIAPLVDLLAGEVGRALD